MLDFILSYFDSYYFSYSIALADCVHVCGILFFWILLMRTVRHEELCKGTFCVFPDS